MTPEARALATLHELAQERSPLRARLFLEWLAARSRGDTDREEYRRSEHAHAPASAEVLAARRTADERARVSRAIDAAEEAESNARAAASRYAFVDPPEAGASSRLDSGVTSDPPPSPAIRLFPGHDDPWLVAVEGLTAPHRTTRAAAHRRAASLALAGLVPGAVDGPAEGFSAEGPTRAQLSKDDLARLVARLPMALDRDGFDADGTLAEFEAWVRKDARARRAHWHWGRGRGQLARFGTAVGCGQGKIRVFCKGCGVIHETKEVCGLGVICVACRARKAKKRNRRFAAAQERTRIEASRRALYRKQRKGGRWGQRFVTLTIPHVEGDRWTDEAEGVGTVGARVRLLFKAWRRFSLRLQAWGRQLARRDGVRIAWYRAFEWTLGADEKGHPHFHIWLHSPFLAETTVAEWWSEALTREGYAIRPDRVIVSVRGARSDIHRELTKGTIELDDPDTDGRRMVRYVEGWTIRDVDENGRRVSPEVAAALYAALDGKRLVQTSRELLDRRAPGCALCGARRAASVTVKRTPRAGQRRGTPPRAPPSPVPT